VARAVWQCEVLSGCPFCQVQGEEGVWTRSCSGPAAGWFARRPGVLAWQERFTGIVIVALGVRLLLFDDARPTWG
jgi:hypothetical protein